MTVRIDADLLIPGRGDPVSNGSVVLEAGTITYAGPTDGAPDADEVAKVPTVMPGLWEAHGHFVGLHTPDIEKLVTTPLPRQASVATIDAQNVYYRNTNDAVRRAIEDGAKTVRLLNVNGQRYIGNGVSVAHCDNALCSSASIQIVSTTIPATAPAQTATESSITLAAAKPAMSPITPLPAGW